MGRNCERCGVALDPSRRRSARFCSKSCANANYKATGANATTREQQRKYALDHYYRERDKRRAARCCAECGAPIPQSSRLSKKFCSRRCVNQVSLREQAFQRHDAAQRRRARIWSTQSPGVSEVDWRRLVNRLQGRCFYCGSQAPITMDHIIPIARGGRHAIGNVVPACAPCNYGKKDKLLMDWLRFTAHTRKAGAA